VFWKEDEIINSFELIYLNLPVGTSKMSAEILIH